MGQYSSPKRVSVSRSVPNIVVGAGGVGGGVTTVERWLGLSAEASLEGVRRRGADEKVSNERLAGDEAAVDAGAGEGRRRVADLRGALLVVVDDTVLAASASLVSRMMRGSVVDSRTVRLVVTVVVEQTESTQSPLYECEVESTLEGKIAGQPESRSDKEAGNSRWLRHGNGLLASSVGQTVDLVLEFEEHRFEGGDAGVGGREHGFV
jgi:hypothetical protein